MELGKSFYAKLVAGIFVIGIGLFLGFLLFDRAVYRFGIIGGTALVVGILLLIRTSTTEARGRRRTPERRGAGSRWLGGSRTPGGGLSVVRRSSRGAARHVAPERAAVGEVAIFYYPWYGTERRDGQWQHWQQNGNSPPAHMASGWFPARGAVLVIGRFGRSCARCARSRRWVFRP